MCCNGGGQSFALNLVFLLIGMIFGAFIFWASVVKPYEHAAGQVQQPAALRVSDTSAPAHIIQNAAYSAPAQYVAPTQPKPAQETARRAVKSKPAANSCAPAIRILSLNKKRPPPPPLVRGSGPEINAGPKPDAQPVAKYPSPENPHN